MLELSTPIPTPKGWSTMGDLKIGDEVFDEQGEICKVTNISEVDLNPESFEMHFSTGEKIKACEGHLWITGALQNSIGKGLKGKFHPRKTKPKIRITKNKYAYASLHKGEKYIGRADDPDLTAKFKIISEADLLQYPISKQIKRNNRIYDTRTTKQIFETLHRGDKACNHSIDMPKAINCEDKKLLIDPYVLGAWLGDGYSASPRIILHKDDIEIIKQFKKANYTCKQSVIAKQEARESVRMFHIKENTESIKRKNSNNFFDNLKDLDLINNKHIPAAYLRASTKQRLSLLQGLMDTDGTINKNGRCISFSTTKETLRDGVSELLWSLGIKHSIIKRKLSKENAKHKDAYILQFFTFRNIPVFRLKRKLNRMRLESNNIMASRSKSIHILDVKRCEPVPMRCISVDSPSKQYLCGRTFIPTHNTTLFSIIGLYMLLADNEPASEVYCCANTKDQAAILWNIAADIAEGSPKIEKYVKILRSTKVILLNQKSWFKAWSSDEGGKDGFDIHCALVDELHEWKGAGREFWQKIRYGGKARKQPLCPIVATTAGSDRFSLCYEQHKYAKKIEEGTILDPTFLSLIYGIEQSVIEEDPEFWKKEKYWKQANPSYEIILSKEDFEMDVLEVENDPTALSQFLRYRLGVWTESKSPWVLKSVWDKNFTEVFTEQELEGQVCFGGMDLSSVEDFTSIVYVFPFWVEEKGYFRYRVLTRIFAPCYSISERVKKLNVPFDHWVNERWITETEGDTIDQEVIYHQILKDSEKFKIKELAYDRNSAAWIVNEVQKQIPEIELFPVHGSFSGMSTATKALTAAIKQGKLEHNNHIPLAWEAMNAVPEVDLGTDGFRLSKKKSEDKIDTIIALVLAFGQANIGELKIKPKYSVYSSPDFADKIKELDGF